VYIIRSDKNPVLPGGSPAKMPKLETTIIEEKDSVKEKAGLPRPEFLERCTDGIGVDGLILVMQTVFGAPPGSTLDWSGSSSGLSE